MVSISRRSEELRPYNLVKNWTISYPGLKAASSNASLAERFVFLGVMIGVFWKRKSRPTKWHQRSPLAREVFVCLHIYSPWRLNRPPRRISPSVTSQLHTSKRLRTRELSYGRVATNRAGERWVLHGAIHHVSSSIRDPRGSFKRSYGARHSIGNGGRHE